MQTRRNFLATASTLAVAAGCCPALSAENRNGKSLPIIRQTDICVLGGSCTGVFAAVRAAKLGAKVVIVEKQNAFGGVATNSLVNVWHSIYDVERKLQIIGGLTVEAIERLKKRDAVIIRENIFSPYVFNSQELKIELDELVIENNIDPMLHTLFSEPVLNGDGELTGVIVDNKSGRGIIQAKQFIDATGDADLASRLGLETYTRDTIQPPTCCAHFSSWDLGRSMQHVEKYGQEFNIPSGMIWGVNIPRCNTMMIAGTRVLGVDCSVADELTKAEIEGRRQIRALMDMQRKYQPELKSVLTALPSYIGIRETRHVKCLFEANDDDALHGRRYADAIANGSYPFDQHHQDKPGVTFRALDGTFHYTGGEGHEPQRGRWREETETNPTFYQIPLRSITPPKFGNLMLAGRMLDAGLLAFSGMRVMVHMNQLGEAAGVAAYLALHKGIPVQKLDANEVRKTLKNGGSIVL